MSQRMIVCVLSFFAIGLTAGTLFAQMDSPLDRSQQWANACERAIQDKVISNNPKAQKVNFDPASERQFRNSNVETIVRGNGSFTRQSGEIENFSFECAYNTTNANVTRVDYSVLQSAGPSTKADPGKGWVQECQSKVKEKITTDYKQAEGIRFSSGRESQESMGVNRLSGEVEFSRPNAGLKTFTYECIYSMREGRVTSSEYKPR